MAEKTKDAKGAGAGNIKTGISDIDEEIAIAAKFKQEEEGREKSYKFLLHDTNLHKNVAVGKSGPGAQWGDRNLGKCVLGIALDQGGKFAGEYGVGLNFTGQAGYCIGVLFSMLYELGKDNWDRNRVTEWIETNPAAPEFHQMIMGQKYLYEDKIKQGLAGISQSVGDLELLEHDIRKYKEFRGYIGDLGSPDEKKKRAATFAVKTIFIDQVDFHAGGGGQGAGRLSLAFMRNNNIMPTIVNDFLMLDSLDDLKEGGKFANLADVEKKMLESKWTLYQHWLGVFRSAIMQRLERLETLRNSRRFTLGQYRSWLKPIMARYRMIETAFDRADRGAGAAVRDDRRTIHRLFLTSLGTGTSYHGWVNWVIKPLTNPETRMMPAELMAKAIEEGEYGKVFGYDEWTQENLIFDTENGLLADYPWLRKDWVDEKAKKISVGLKKSAKPYYSFLRIDTWRTLNKTPSGAQIEDAYFNLWMYTFSANVILAKYLELEAMEEETERYMDKMLGIKPTMETNYHLKVVGYRKKGFEYVVVGGLLDPNKANKYKNKKEMLTDYSDKEYYLTPLKPENYYKKNPKKDIIEMIKDMFFLDAFWFFKKKGPYEHQFYDRLTKFLFKLNGERFNGIVNSFLGRMKIEEVNP